MKNDICLNCNINCIDVDDMWIRCSQCDKRYVRSTVLEEDYAVKYPSASTIPRAYNPIWGASAMDQIQELVDEGYPNILLGRKW